MPGAELGLREQLAMARAKVERQLDLLRARPYPYADAGLVVSLLMLICGGFGPPFRTNGVMIDNSDLIARLTDMLHQIDDALQNLGPDD